MISKGYIPRVGDIIDAFHYKANRNICGTVKTTIDKSNLDFIVVKVKDKDAK